MSVKKTSSPLSSGTEGIEQLGAKEELQRGKVEKNFEAALAELAGQIEKTDGNGKTDNPTQTAFRQIAANANLDSPEGAMSAVRESAHFLVNSRLNDGLKDSEEGKRVTEDLSSYISKDPFLHRKILNILQRLK